MATNSSQVDFMTFYCAGHTRSRYIYELMSETTLDERKKKHCDIFLLSLALAASLPTARMAAYTRWGATQTGIHMAKLSSGLHSFWY